MALFNIQMCCYIFMLGMFQRIISLKYDSYQQVMSFVYEFSIKQIKTLMFFKYIGYPQIHFLKLNLD